MKYRKCEIQDIAYLDSLYQKNGSINIQLVALMNGVNDV